MASPNLSEIVTTTIRNRSRQLADNVSDNTPLLYKLKQKDKIRPFAGGRNITQELEYAENSTYKRYSGYENLDISPSDVFTAAEFEIKQAAVSVSISGLEQLQNSSKEAMIDLLDSRIKNAERTMINNITADMYSDGTASSGKQIDGLAAAISDTPAAGTYGGINAATWSFWRNQEYDFSDEAVTASSSTIQTAMNTLYLSLCRNADKPDLWIAGDTYFLYYLESLQANQRFMDDKMAQAGFQNLMFMGAPVVLGGGNGGQQSATTMAALNCDYLHYRPHQDRDMVPLDPDRFSTNQDAMVKLIGWAGNMTCSNRSLQGGIYA